MALDRRDFLKWFSGTLVGGAVIGGSYGVAETLRQATKHHTLSTPKWPSHFEKLTIAAVGDLHVGCMSVPLARTHEIVSALNAMNPDIIVLLGDFLCSKEPGGAYVPPKDIAQALSNLKAKHGTYAVLGNHDWYNDGQGMWNALEDANITVLENKAVPIMFEGKRMWVAGLADDITRTPDIHKTLRHVPKNEPVVMLTHDPGTFLDTTDQPVVTLAGHTHGGQIAFPFVGPIKISGRSPLRYAYGHIHENGNDLIVTSGIGTSVLPLRALACPEIMRITVQSA